MEHFGLLSILPPLLTIVLAVVTKDVVISLFLGILSGTVIAAGGNPYYALIRLSDLIADTLADGWNIRIMLFTILLGLMVGLLSKSGAAYSLGDWAGKKIKSRTGALIFTWIFGLLIFFDDYFNSLTIGTCMRPLTDAKKISRAKLAYIIDSTAAPVAILAPISGWVAFVIGTYKEMPEWQSLGVGEFTFFLKSIPFNLYAIFAVFMVLFITLTHKDFGPMARSEARAMKGLGLFDEEKFGVVVSQVESKVHTNNAKPFDFLIPIGAVIAIALFFFPMTTWMNAVDGVEITSIGQAISEIPLGQAFNDTDSSMALMYALIFSTAFGYVYFVARRLLDIKAAGEALLDGFRAMVPAAMILTLAWALGTVIKTPASEGGVGLGIYIAEVVVGGNFPISFLPLVVFLLSAIISFASGTSWGTMGIMVPVSVPIIVQLAKMAGISPAEAVNATALTIGAVMGGSVFGDHCSPISDTTILSSTGAAAPHLEHVATQLPYALFVAFCVMLGTIAGGLSWSPIVGIVVTAVPFVAGTYLLPIWFGPKRYGIE
ncbi:MAG: sodium:proton antiporter [Spirochaetae bacterium HGW-Spirochaetae-3]|jgi:Na+/H+ antiporter NhaC|nr:MAG: sodium:proton antiporter [Spirochaetae bacterium HGW-Spirochaetae-3]